MRVLLVLLVMASGCATTSELNANWLTPDQLVYDASKYPDDAAVVLYRADRYLLETTGNDFSEVLRHVVVAIQREGGFDLAEVKIPFNTRQDIVVLKARVVQPDGTVKEVSARDVLVDTNGKGERDWQAKFFRFPDVQVGSVLEYVWVVRSPWIVGADDQDTLGEFPVRSYDFELVGSRKLVLETIEYNSTQPIDVAELNDGRHRLRFSLRDLPPREPEQWMPHWTFTEPRWAYRVLGYKSSTLVTDNWYREWTDVVEPLARRSFVDPETFEGLPRPDLSKCADAQCKVTTATEWIREKTSTLGVNSNRELKLGEAFQSGKASAKERAMILRKVLDEAGVEAKLAFTTRYLARQTARSFPEVDQFDRLHVYVPAQPSIPRPMAIELEAEFCPAGSLSPTVAGQPAFVFWMEGGAVGRGVVKGEWLTLEGDPGVVTRRRDVHAARLEGDGSLVDDHAMVVEGELSEPWQQNHLNWRARDFERDLERRAGSVSPLAKSVNPRWTECDRLKGRCGYALTMKARRYAVRDGTSWLVPLKLLTPLYEVFDVRERRHEVHIGGGVGPVEETLELQAPPGFHAAQVPDTVTETVPGVSVRITAERTKTGVRVTRRVALKPGVYPRDAYLKMRDTLERFQAVRNTVLTFEPD
jgi:hypothetical protein